MSNHGYITVSDMNRAVIACRCISVRELEAGRKAESLAYKITALKNDRNRKCILGEEMPNYTRMIRDLEKQIEELGGNPYNSAEATCWICNGTGVRSHPTEPWHKCDCTCN